MRLGSRRKSVVASARCQVEIEQAALGTEGCGHLVPEPVRPLSSPRPRAPPTAYRRSTEYIIQQLLEDTGMPTEGTYWPLKNASLRLQEARIACEHGMSAAQLRLRRVGWLQLFAQLMSVLGSTGTIVLILSRFTTGSYISAAIALFGSVATVSADYSRQGLGGTGNIALHLTELVDAGAIIQDLAPKFRELLMGQQNTTTLDPGQVTRLIEAANDVIRRVNKTVPMIPGATSKPAKRRRSGLAVCASLPSR
jgi:hypothetical protein